MGYGHPFCYGILSAGFADFLFLPVPRATTISHENSLFDFDNWANSSSARG